MKYFKIFTFISIIGLFYTSCVKKASYPDIPQITYNSYTPFTSGSQVDSALLRVNFTDGNGQIGYPQQETGVPLDFYVSVFVYVNGTKTYDSVTTFSYGIPYITPSGNDKELNGIIQINFGDLLQLDVLTPLAAYPPGYLNIENLQFKVWLYDRQRNKSNVLIIPSINPYE